MAKGTNPPRKPASKADKESKLFVSLAKKGENARIKEILKASPPAELTTEAFNSGFYFTLAHRRDVDDYDAG